MYCVDCNRIVVGDKCPICGRRALRLPEPGDWCFLAEQEMLWVQALSDLLTDNGIRFRTRNVFGAGRTAKLGHAAERVRFFVPYAQFSTAEELLNAFFSAEFVFEE